MKKFCLVVFLFIACQCLGGDTWKKCAEFTDTRYGETIVDVEQHYKPLSYMYPASTYRNYGEFINWAHELTHAVNSLIRNTYGNSDTHQAIYCLKDVCYVFRTPKCTLYDVRKRVKVRGPSYQLYFVQMMGDWHHQPLYPLDELSAYTIGTIAGLEKYGAVFTTKFSLERAEEFNGYARVALKTIEELDPRYPDLEKLREYLDFNTVVLKALRSRFKA